jgi:hypothetical protein
MLSLCFNIKGVYMSMHENEAVNSLSTWEIVEILINRHAVTNGFDFVTENQMRALIACYNDSMPEIDGQAKKPLIVD